MATPISEIKGTVQSVRDFFDTGATKSYEWRVSQLQALCRMMSENKQIWEDAMTKDLSQNRFLKTTEVQSTITEAQNAISNLKDWMKPQKQENLTVMNVPGTAMIVKEPFGTVLIISPFNYPVSLLTKPLVGALAAGNCAILKPSELTPSVADAFAKLVPKYLDQRAVRVILGAIPETTELLKQVFDYILYTGNPQVAKIIMRAAAENLTPVTLELGGKSPCIIDKQVDLDVAAKRITWGKFLNNGQTCVAPDYLFVHKDVKNKLIEKMKQNVEEFYGKDPKQSPDYSRIVSERHTQRLAKLLEGNEKKIILGGQVDISEKYIAPTLIDSPSLDTPLMQEEIFGPILPVLTYDRFDDVIDFINKRPKPLALYLFSSNSTLKDDVIKRTSSGATVINDVVVHNIVDTLPFGGVGNSGMGAYNGRFTFDTFSHNKTVFVKPTFIDPFARYPPYNDTKIGIVSLGLGWSLKGLKTVAAYTLPVIIGGLTYYVLNSKL